VPAILLAMRVNVVSDVHGRADALARAADGADALICLGDLLLFLDYADHGQGIFPDLFGAEAASQLIALRTAQRFDEARQLSARLWAGLGGDPRQHLDRAVSRQYAELFAAMPTPAYLTYGNVDVPRLWGEHLRSGQHVLDGQRVELGGWTFGFVGGGLRSTYRTPNELDDEEFAAKVAAVGQVDVLCAHIPPDVPELLFDTVARRMERGSEALLAAIRRTQPRYALFGHVHQPLASRLRIDGTECVNVGHFRATGQPFALEW
jgi:Icc-related predicted phosphoesterase